MSVIRIGGFQGELPRIHPRLLPDTAAQTALNCRTETGALDSIRNPASFQALESESPNDIISIYKYTDAIWLESDYDMSWVSYPVANDSYGRIIFTYSGMNKLLVTDASLVGTGGGVANSFRLDVPAPTIGFSATVTGTADDDDEVPETRYYVCTYVNSWGSEGPPSPTTNQVEWRTGQAVDLASIPSAPAGEYNITHRRIYRINTGASGATEFQFVTEIANASNGRNITNITQTNPVAITTEVSHGLSDGQEVKFSNLGTMGVAKTITGISKSNPCRVTVNGHGFSSGSYVQILGAEGMTEINGLSSVITIVDDDRFDLDTIDATGFTAWTNGGTASAYSGMGELDENRYFVAVIDATNFSLLGIDGTAFSPYLSGGVATQIHGNTYTDNVPSANLAEVIPTELYDPPNISTAGLVEHPSGFLAGFFGNTLAFSEPGAPHAWPIDYRLVTAHDIVGLGVFGNTVAVMTEGWPYLAIGSDPSAISLVELEIEQACVAKRGIVDFGTAIAYPSPDGLIVLSTNGATNASSGIFTRDQWQALVPAQFVAFNWEQKYLCFYDTGSVQRGFIIDPFDAQAGVRYVDEHAVGGFKDIEEDLIYMLIDGTIKTWDQATTKFQYTWKSKPTYTPHAVNMSAAKVIADAYPVTADFYVDGIRRYTRLVGSLRAFRLPSGFRGEKFEVVLKGTRRVSEIIMATTMRELSITV